ncbi:MAG: BMP family ABC transporter substrate-binding protein [Erysipelotrichaceae bacterium]|nr:BMP family ABC transporter substrate-binding protein [Erysipelotrichaceae bacterium]
MLSNYLEAKKLADREYARAVSHKEEPSLSVLENILKDRKNLGSQIVGRMEIPLSRVVGTKNTDRAESFANNFMPLLDEKSEFAWKWARLYDIQMEEGFKDPVKVYEYLWNFYVEEGNKRVSVLKYLRGVSVYADVTRIIPARDGSDEIEAYYEFMDFFEVAPTYRLICTKPGSYKRIAEILGENLSDKWPEEKISSLNSSFIRFSDIYNQLGGDELDLAAGDAFIKYLSVYDYASILDDDSQLLSEKLKSIWNELLTQGNADAIVLKDTVDKGQKSVIRQILKITPVHTKTDPLKIAFIHQGNTDESAWVSDHEIGRMHLNSRMDGLVESWAYFNCHNDEKTSEAIEDSIQKGAEVIFTTSAEQINETLRCAIRYPQIRFYNCIINLTSNSVRSYYGRLFEAKFLMGILAGQLSENHKIGYLADYPLYGTITNLNAFALGVSAIDPKGKVYVYWKHEDWKKKMEKEGIRIISGVDMAEPELDNTEYGIFELEKDGNVINYGNVVWNWGKYYDLIVRPIAEGYILDKDIRNDQSLFLWWGMSQGVIDVHLSARLSHSTNKTIQFYKDSIISGNYRIFDGELRDQNGDIIFEKDHKMTNDAIVTMDWLNENIVGKLPDYDDLDEAGKRICDVCGIPGYDKTP